MGVLVYMRYAEPLIFILSYSLIDTHDTSIVLLRIGIELNQFCHG